MLSLQNICVSRNGERIVDRASLRIGTPGLMFIVGAGGAGKSTLLAALAGRDLPQLHIDGGKAEFDGQPLADCQDKIRWLGQHALLAGSGTLFDCLSARLQVSEDQVLDWLVRRGVCALIPVLAESVIVLSKAARRCLEVLVSLEQNAQLHLLDEPTADLDADQIDAVRSRIAEVSRHACVMVATHNRQDCIVLGGDTALLAGGTIQECADSAHFFEAPTTPAARTYVATGNCNLPRVTPFRATHDGQWWLVPGLLCGMSRPGMVKSAVEQYARLRTAGVRQLICLEERCHYEVSAARESGLAHHHFAVADMAAPSFNQTVDLCRIAESSIQRNEGVAVHCRGGLGRTGTALAAILIWFGDDPAEAIAKVRRAQPLAIQSLSQFHFLHEFADRIRGWNTPATPDKENFDVPRQGTGNSTV